MDEFATGTTTFNTNLNLLIDHSGSTAGQPINQINAAIPEIRDVAIEAAKAKETGIQFRIIGFSDKAGWKVGDRDHGVESFDWTPIDAGGGTNTAAAIDLIASINHRSVLGDKNYPPITGLLSDGQSNEPAKTLQAIEKLKKSIQNGIRFAIGVGDANRAELEAFASVGDIVHPDGTVEENVPLVFDVDNIDSLKDIMKKLTVSSIITSTKMGTSNDDRITLNLEDTDTDKTEEGDDDWN